MYLISWNCTREWSNSNFCFCPVLYFGIMYAMILPGMPQWAYLFLLVDHAEAFNISETKLELFGSKAAVEYPCQMKKLRFRRT